MAEKAQGRGDCATSPMAQQIINKGRIRISPEEAMGDYTTTPPTGLPVDPQRKRGGIGSVTARTSEMASPGSRRTPWARRKAKRATRPSAAFLAST